MALTNYVLVPSNGETGVSLTPVIKFNCDNAFPAPRSTFDEAVYDIRIIVNSVTVYSKTGVGLFWDDGTPSRITYNATPTTPQGSAAIWFPTQIGDGMGLVEGQSYQVVVEIADAGVGNWAVVATNTFTTLSSGDDLEGSIASASSLTGDIPELNKPINPTPLTASTNIIPRLVSVTWEDGGGATKYDVYTDFGIPELELVLVDFETTNLSYSLLSRLGESRGYSWRVDAKDDNGNIAKGDVWTFSTRGYFVGSRPDGYDSNLAWQEDPDNPGIWGWFDLETTGGGRFKDQVVVIGHGVIYYGDL